MQAKISVVIVEDVAFTLELLFILRTAASKSGLMLSKQSYQETVLLTSKTTVTTAVCTRNINQMSLHFVMFSLPFRPVPTSTLASALTASRAWTAPRWP